MKKNKKGFTLTELIVVIVIIGILAAVLIPTLTGYINRAKESAAEQEATNYITAYTAWQLETPADEQDLDSFQAYCVDLELVAEADVESVILEVNVAEKSFVIKASNDLFVKYTNGDFEVDDETLVTLEVEEPEVNEQPAA